MISSTPLNWRFVLLEKFFCSKYQLNNQHSLPGQYLLLMLKLYFSFLLSILCVQCILSMYFRYLGTHIDIQSQYCYAIKYIRYMYRSVLNLIKNCWLPMKIIFLISLDKVRSWKWYTTIPKHPTKHNHANTT